MDATGHMCNSMLQASISYISINPRFCDVITRNADIVRNFKKVTFMPVVLAEANYLLDTFIRDTTCVLISCKMFDTSIAVVTGDQLVALETIHMGTAHVINDISLVKNCDYISAQAMLAHYKGEGEIAKIVTARIEDIAEQIQSTIGIIDPALYSKPVYICGGYIDAIPNAKKIIEQALVTKITQLACPYNETNKPDITSRDAVIYVTLN